MAKKLIYVFISIVFLVYVSGCATITGPAVSSEEIARVREELKVKALAYRIKQLQRLYNIGTRLILAVHKEDSNYPAQPFLGIICSPIDKYLEQIYNLGVKKGLVIVVVPEKGPADDAGLQPGDVLVSINGTKIDNAGQLNLVVSRFKIGEPIQIQVLRGSNILTFKTQISQIPLNAPIIMVDSSEVNAATDGKAIFVTYGLVNFAKSDDEIAAVLGHELAHAVRGHVNKMQGGEILSLIAALVLGMAAENSSPGSGEGVMRGVSQIGNIFNAGYSRDLEREADYFGAKFVYYAGYNVDVCATVEERFAIEMPATMVQSYLSTHPSSPERVARIKKIIAELKAQNLP